MYFISLRKTNKSHTFKKNVRYFLNQWNYLQIDFTSCERFLLWKSWEPSAFSEYAKRSKRNASVPKRTILVNKMLVFTTLRVIPISFALCGASSNCKNVLPYFRESTMESKDTLIFSVILKNSVLKTGCAFFQIRL